MNNVLITNKRVLNVDNNNGILTITNAEGDEIKNPGMFINEMGGVDAILQRCRQTEKSAKDIADEILAEKEERKSANANLLAEKKEAIVKAYKHLVAKGTIETTPENIEIVLRFLNTKNWGLWSLPKMTIPYHVNQYQINATQTATTMVIDNPVDYEGKKIAKFVVGARVSHLSSYAHLG